MWISRFFKNRDSFIVIVICFIDHFFWRGILVIIFFGAGSFVSPVLISPVSSTGSFLLVNGVTL